MAQLSKWIAVVVLPSLVSFAAARANDIEVVRGKIRSVDASKSEFVLTDQNDKELPFKLGNDATIHPGKRPLVEEFLEPDGRVDVAAVVEVMLGVKRVQGGPEMELAGLQPGDEVIVTYVQGCKQATALEVCIGRMVLKRK